MLHLLLAAAIAYGLFIKLDRDLGTEDVNIELVEPRRATTPRNHADRLGEQGGATRVSPSRVAEKLASAAVMPQVASKATSAARAVKSAVRRDALPKEDAAQSGSRAQRSERAKLALVRPAVARAEHQRIEPQQPRRARARSKPVESKDTRTQRPALRVTEYGALPERRPKQRVHHLPKKATRSLATRARRALLLTAMAVPAVKPNPKKLLRAVKHRIARRKRRRKAFRRRRAAERARVNAAFRALVARSRAAARGGRALGSGGRMSGKRGGKRVGLKFYLDGRRVLSSRVVTPPEPIKLPRVRCGAVPLGSTPTTVRMLVTLDGVVDVAYVKHSSGSRRFDRCAIKQAKGMKFKPGLDETGAALDVWIHLRVQPSLSLAER